MIEVPKKNFLEYAKKITKGFNLSWLYDCDIMLNKNSQPVLMELNPRISGSLSASLEAGVPLIDDLISLAKNVLESDDVISTINCLKKLGVKINWNKKAHQEDKKYLSEKEKIESSENQVNQ